MTLNNVRVKIDKIDDDIKALFLKRMKAAEEVAVNKYKAGDKILKTEREDEVISRLTEDLKGEMKLFYTSFQKKVMEVSRTYQYGKLLELGADFRLDFTEEEPAVEKACYQGLPGSYSNMAAGAIFPDAEILPVASFEDVFTSIGKDGVQAGVVPLENTTAGSVYQVYDLLVKHDLFINYTHIVKVSHCLAAIHGAGLADIREVYSHPQAIAQSDEFLKQYGMNAKESSNTAVAANDVANRNEKTIGAICSREAAERYGLNILLEGVNHNKDNATKFAAVSKNLVIKDNHDKTALVFATPHRSGSLASVLGIFGDYGVNLTELHSRPDGIKSWEYLFYVDFSGNIKDKRIKTLLYQLYEELPFVKIIGSYESK